MTEVVYSFQAAKPFKCTNIQMHKYTNAQINAQRHKCTNTDKGEEMRRVMKWSTVYPQLNPSEISKSTFPLTDITLLYIRFYLGP